MLMNFTTSSNSKLSAKQLAAIKGQPKGHWRDRRNAKRAQEYESDIPHFPAPRKTPKVTTGHGGVSKHSSIKGSSSSSSNSDHPRKSAKEPNGTQAPPKDGIVSSLFTYNPEISRAPSQSSESRSSELVSTNAPLTNSTEFPVNDTLKRFLVEKVNLKTPTQIQSTAIPAILNAQKSKNDVVMVAQTGSGKTLAYLLPLFSFLMNMPQRIDRTSGVFAVILAPTRELATQIFQVCEEICRCCHYIVPGLVIGGEKKKSEKARLRKGVNILIGTPGRMADHVDNTANLNFRKTEFVVLDEGDRLIDLGFEETLTQILAKIPESRTTILCSATMNTQASRLKTLALSEPISWVREQKRELAAGGDSSDGNAVENTPGQLVQKISIVPAKLRLVTLAAKLRAVRHRSKRAVVFFSCTDSVDFHYQVFTKFQPSESPVFRLHGSMTQQQRTETLSEFLKSKNGGVLLTTDVASRGLDAPVDEVIEYDPPFTIEDHLHRAGRTARAGRRGEALLFLLPAEQEYEKKVNEAHSSAIRTESYQNILQRGFGFGDWMDKATSWQLEIEKAVVKDTDGIAELAKKAFTAHVRAYTTHSSAERSIFNLRELHLGHLAKAFALREAPKAITSAVGSSGSNGSASSSAPKKKKLSARQAMLEAAQRQMEVGEYNVM